METMTIVWILLALIAGMAAGFSIGWPLAGGRAREAARREFDGAVRTAQQQASDAAAKLSAASATAQEIRQQYDSLKKESEAQRIRLEETQQTRVAAETALAETQRSFAEQRRSFEDAQEKLKDAFQALAADALTQSNIQFLQLAQSKFGELKAESTGALGQREQAIRGIVDPLNKSLDKLKDEIAQVESSRQRAYGELLKQVEDLKKETGGLVTSLRQPHVKGRWGELTLRRSVELAGMNPHVDFLEQEQFLFETQEGKEERARPDMIIRLPGGRQIVVDAKAPLQAYEKMDGIKSNEEFFKVLEEHAKLVRKHMESLSRQEYWNKLPDTTDFVVLFLPGENFFSGALQTDPSLIADAIERKVILTSPTTLIALLRAVAYGWRQQELAENAERISDLGKELFERVAKFMEYMEALRAGLETANRAFNSAVGSLEQRLLPGARKFRELGVQSAAEIPEIVPTETALRSLAARSGSSEE